MRKLAWALMVMGAAVWAAEPDWQNLTYVTLLNSDPGGAANSSCIPANCQDQDNPRWSDGQPIHEGAHYLVGLNGSDERIRLDGPGSYLNPVNWAGLSFSLAGQIDFNVEVFNVDVMRMIGGCLLTQPSSGSFNVTDCYVKDSSPAKPVELGTNRKKTDVKIWINWPVKVTFHGDDGQALLFHRYGGQLNSAITLINSDFSDFNGRVIFGTGGDGDVGGTNFIGNLTLSGALEVQNKSFLAMSSENYAAQVDELVLKSGATLMFAVKDDQAASSCKAASMAVNTAFSAEQGIKIRPILKNTFGTSVAYVKADHVFALFKLTSQAAANLPDASCFELEGWPTRLDDVGCAPRLEYRDTDGGGKALCVVYPAINMMNTGNVHNTGSAMDENHKDYWTFNRLPVAGEEAIITKRFIPLASGTGSSFPGKRLFSEGGEITLYNDISPFFVDETYLRNSGFISMSFEAKTGTFEGNELWVCGTDASPCFLESAGGGHLVVKAPWKGTGKMRITTKSGTGDPRGWISPTADNSGFAGKLQITCGLGNAGSGGVRPFNPSKGITLGLNVENGNNLGGAMADGEFCWNGIEIASEPLIKMTNSVTFVEPTRGIYINGAPRFVLVNPEDELTFNSSVTYCGTFIFGNNYPGTGGVTSTLGTGLLTFAAPAYFHDANESGKHDVPTPGCTNNNLQVLAGSVRATATNGLDGVAITFGPQAEGIFVSTDAEDELAAYGLYDVKWGVPFTSQRADGKIPVRVGAVNASYNGEMKELAICTVSGTAAAFTQNSFVSPPSPMART